MRSLVRQRASAAASLRCTSSFRRVAPAQALRGILTDLSCGFASIENKSQRWYSTTAVLHKQLPTSTGSSSVLGDGPTASAASSNRSRKQSSAVASRDGASAAVAVERELNTVPSSVDAAVNTDATVGSVSAPHIVSKAGTSTRAKVAKRGRRKQNDAASLHSSTSTGRSTGAAGARKRQSDVSVEASTACNSQVVEEEVRVSSANTSVRGKRKGKDARGKRQTVNAKLADAAGTPLRQPSLQLSSLGSTPPAYYTHNMLESTPRTEEQRMAERCSITKLIMVSASVSFLFTALPRTEGQLKMYMRDMNRVQVPSAASAALLGGTSPSLEGPVPTEMPALTSKQFHELRQRLCAEQYATNTVFIHVREMEQLVPPLHLQPPPTVNEGAVTANENPAATQDTSSSNGSISSRSAADSKTRGRRGRRSRTQDAITTTASTTPIQPLSVLSPVERLLALQDWKKAAARRAKETQTRYPTPAHFHTITRVRFHDPHQTDLTVAMGGGLNKSTDSVLRAIVRNMHREENDDSSGEWLAGEEEDDDTDNDRPPFPMPDPSMTDGEVMTEAAADIPEPEQPAFVSSPYAVKPLLTVCASCVPRREAWIGTCSPKPSITMGETRSAYSVRPLPTVPRFSTRITIMLEHDEMDPADLVSLAEISTPRKPSPPASVFGMDSDVSVRGGGVDVAGGESTGFLGCQKGQGATKRPLQLYCLVQDAGEY